MQKLVALIFVFTGLAASAETIQFICRIGFNWSMLIELNTDTGSLGASSNQGEKWQGTVNSYYSPSHASVFYFLPTSFNHGVELEVSSKTKDKAKMCLNPNDCTLCPRIEK